MENHELLETEVAAVASETRPSTLVPGSHLDDRGIRWEVGSDQFAAATLEALPGGALYRWDYVVGELVRRNGRLRFVEVSEHRLRSIVDQHVKLGKWTLNRDKEAVLTYVACTRDHAGLLLAAAAVSNVVRDLQLLTNHPVYGPDFELVQPGWNEASGIYYDEPAELAGLSPRAEGALDLLDDLVVDFPFRDDASRHNVFGLMITRIVRPALNGTIPFHLFLSSLERTGKGKLINAASGLAISGEPVPSMQLGSSEEEREKRITALIIEGSSAIHIDNLPMEDVLNSAALASLATSRVWKGRLLGKSRLPTLANNLVVALSGNNVRATGELVKRTVPIVLQPLDDHPEDRTAFQHPEIEIYAQQCRREVLEALIGMVEEWKLAGRPECSRRMGGFEEWVRVVGGVLIHAGADSWMANYRDWVRRADEFAADAAELIAVWQSRYGGMAITAKQVLEMVKEGEMFPWVTARPDAGQLVCLAKRVLTPLTDRPVGEWIVIRDGSGASSRYRLEPALPI